MNPLDNVPYPNDADGDRPSIDDLVAELKARVAARRASGEYPEDLEESLDAHFRWIARHRQPGYDFDVLKRRLFDVDATYGFSPDSIVLESRLPGGDRLHQLIGKIVSRQTAGILAQVQLFAEAVRAAMWEMAAALEAPPTHAHRDLLEQTETLFEEIATLRRAPTDEIGGLREIYRRLEVLDAERARRDFRPWFSYEKFEDRFRGSAEELVGRYRDLADLLAEHSPVIDIGCGRGDLLALLLERGVDAVGIDIDTDLVHEGRRRGLPVEHGDAVTSLRTRPDESIGGLALIQVVEHLTAQELVDVVALCRDKLRRGGKVVVETVNPQSLYVFAHSFYLDPTHEAPVHPAYLQFLFQEAGFAEVAIDWRSPCPPDDLIESPAGDEAAAANVERINRLLFAPQDYAVIATR